LGDKSHKLILSKLILESVRRNQVLDNSFFNACCPTLICLNNYIKLRTDALHRNKVKKKKKRKIQTLL
jgi:hypothetical protein